MSSVRSIRMDLIKSIAIISVIFYHMGFQQYGYLGVDIFLVVAGYFLGQSLLKTKEKEEFSFFSFLFGKILRLWPLLLIACLVCLVLGFFVMLPDDYENLAQSAFATNFFANNILSAITTKNYWDIINDFKPLMHTWYVGVLMQGYVIFALIAKLAHRFKHNARRYCTIGFAAISLISLTLYLLPILQEYEKFYYFPTRLFEMGIGAFLSALRPSLLKKFLAVFQKRRNAIFCQIILFIGLTTLVTLPLSWIPASFRLLSVVLVTALLIVSILRDDRDWDSRPIKWISNIGKASFSFFVWHQIIIAFMKYIWCAKFEVFHILVGFALTCIVSILSFSLLETKISQILRDAVKKRRCLIGCLAACLGISAISLAIVFHAGVVRDVPELGIDTSNVRAQMHASYCDRVYNYDKAFSKNDKIKVLVLGNSFGRDFGNILLESNYADEIELSYATTAESAGQARIETASYIFYAVSENQFSALPEPLLRGDIFKKVFVVGNKNFGDNNGTIYNRRYRADYLDSSVTLTDDYFLQNKRLKQQFGNAYIDLIEPVCKEDGTIRVFTKEGKFLSQDCRHLTVFGAQYYAEALNLEAIFE